MAQASLLQSGIRLAVAESCTGGYIAHLITSLPGASRVFEASITAYCAEAKQQLLGVKAETINRHGTVSPETALAMAHGAARATGTEAALAVTGVLGPGTIENKKAGLVYAAVIVNARAGAKEFQFTGDRESINKQAAAAALQLLNEALSSWD